MPRLPAAGGGAKELQAGLDGLAEPSPPPEFLSGLQDRLAQERPAWRTAREAESRRIWRQSWQVAAAAAGLGVALFLAWVCGQAYGEGISGAQAWSSLHGMVQATAEEYEAAAASARQLPARAPGWWNATQAWADDAGREVIGTVGLGGAAAIAALALMLNVLFALPKDQLRLHFR